MQYKKKNATILPLIEVINNNSLSAFIFSKDDLIKSL